MPTQKHNFFYYTLLFCTTFFWGISYIFTKSLLDVLTPVSIIFFRLMISAIFLCTVSFIVYRKSIKEIFARDFINLFALSFFEPFLYFLFETYGIKYAGPSIVAVLVATIPVFSLFFSVLYFKEPLNKINIIGVFVSVAGVIVMLIPGFAKASFNIWGIVLSLCAVLTGVGGSFFLRKLAVQYPSVVIVTCKNTIGALLFLPLFFILHRGDDLALQCAAFTRPELLRNVLILAVCCSSIAYIFLAKGMQKVGLSRTQTFTNLIPVVTMVVSYCFFDEHITIPQIVGTIIVIAGIIGVQYQGKTATIA